MAWDPLYELSAFLYNCAVENQIQFFPSTIKKKPTSYPFTKRKTKQNRNDVYETLCPYPLLVQKGS